MRPFEKIPRWGTRGTVLKSLLLATVLSSVAASGRAQGGPAVRLAFIVEAHSTAANAAIAPAVRVAVEDARGKFVLHAETEITLALESSATAGATLGGTLARRVAGGVATFPDLAIDLPGQRYVLQASASVSGLYLSATSRPFDIYIPTSVSFAPSSPSVKFGDSVTLTATVSPCTAEYGPLRGSVQFRAGPALLAVVPIDAAGSGCGARTEIAIADPSFPEGRHPVVAAFTSSNPNYGSTSQTRNLDVVPAQLTADWGGDTPVSIAGGTAAVHLRVTVSRAAREPALARSTGPPSKLFDRLNADAGRLVVDFLDCSAVPCEPLGTAAVHDSPRTPGTGAATLAAVLPPGVYAISARARQTAAYFVSSTNPAGQEIVATAAVAVVVAPASDWTVVGAGWVADPASATGESSFGFAVRFGPGLSSPSGTSLLVFPSVFQGVPVTVRIRSAGPVRVVQANEHRLTLIGGARIEMLDPASGSVVAGPAAGEPARLTMGVAAGSPARYALEVLKPDGTLSKLIGTFSGGRLGPIPVTRGRIAFRGAL